MKRSLTIAMAILLTLAMLATGVASAQDEPAPSPLGGSADGEENIFTVGSISDMVTISPFKACCGSEYETFFIIYDQLLNFDPETLEAAPGIAESWEGNDDATEWTFKIRPDMQWSDGEPVTSADVKFTYEFILNNRPNAFASYLPGNPTFEAPDPATFIYRTKESSLAPVSPAWVPILPEHIWSKYDRDIKAAKEARLMPTVGTGPFVLVDWKEGQFYTFEKNPYWRGEEPAIDKLIFRLYDVPESMVQALKSGEVDFAEDISPALFDQLVKEKDPAIEPWVASPAYFYDLAFGLWKPNQKGSGGETPTNHPALQDVQVRVAIAKAIDKQALVDRVKLGYATPGSSVLMPRDRWHMDPSQSGDTTQDFDPAEANRILDEAGYLDADGDGVREMPGGGNPLEFQFLTLTDRGASVETGEYIKDWLKDIGMKVQLKPVTSGKATDAWYAHDYDAYVWGWGNEPDPDFTLSLFTTGQCDVWSDGCYSNPEYDQLYLDQRAASTDQERVDLVNEMQKFIYDEVPIIVLFYENDLQAWRKDKWTGMVPQPSPNGSVMYAWSAASYANLKPVVASETEATTADDDGNSATIWIVVGIAVLLLIVIGVALARRKPVEDRE